MEIVPLEKQMSDYYENQVRKTKKELGKDEFLLLLTEQLKNQDPLNPMEDMQFISQMANFSSLEQMLNMNTSLEKFLNNFSTSYKSQAMMFLGTTVTAQSEEMLESVTGVVEEVEFINGVPVLKIGEDTFSVDDVLKVTPTYYEF